MKTHSETKAGLQVTVRRIHRRDLNRTWEFLKKVFRDVNRETVEYQRPWSKKRFFDIYKQQGVEQLLFEINKVMVGYAECAYNVSGDDNWVNPRYFDKRGMRPLYVEELAVDPDHQGHGVGGFMLEQLQHLARVRGCTHLVLEVAENNELALAWYRKRNFFKMDAAIFLAQKLPAEPELLPPRKLVGGRIPEAEDTRLGPAKATKTAAPAIRQSRQPKAAARTKAGGRSPVNLVRLEAVVPAEGLSEAESTEPAQQPEEAAQPVKAVRRAPERKRKSPARTSKRQARRERTPRPARPVLVEQKAESPEPEAAEPSAVSGE